MKFEFTCNTCGQVHKGMPSFGADKPLHYYGIPEIERRMRCDCGSDHCIIDGKWFFVRGCIEIAVHGEKEPFVWGAWASLSNDSFASWSACFDKEIRSHIGPFFGWLNTRLKPYPNTVNLKTRVHLRDHGVRPRIEIEPSDHPLAIEQTGGISKERVAALYSAMVHA